MAHCYGDNITRPFWPKGLAKEQRRTSTRRLNGNYRKLIGRSRRSGRQALPSGKRTARPWRRSRHRSLRGLGSPAHRWRAEAPHLRADGRGHDHTSSYLWRQMNTYDLLVIGSDPAGQCAAISGVNKQSGWRLRRCGVW
jgi:hypothetical protein